jgi:hypothetical protein
MKNIVRLNFLPKTFCDSLCALMDIYGPQSLVSSLSVLQQDSFLMNDVS